MSFSISPAAAASPSSQFPDLPPPPQPPPEAPPPLVIAPAVAFISPPAPPLPPPPLPEPVPPSVAPVAADPPPTATPPSPPLLPPSVASPPPSPPVLPPSVASPPPLLPPFVASPPPSATAASPPAPAIIPAAPDVSSPPPQESKPLPRHHEPIPMTPSRKPHSPPPPQLPSVPSSPAKPQAQPLPTLLPPPSPASPPSETSSSESAPPVSSEPFFAEIPLSPPASTAASPPPAELLNGSLPLTVNGGQSQSIAGQRSAHEYHVSTGIIVGFAIGGVLLLAMVVLSCFVFRWKKKQKLNSGIEKDYYASQGQKVVTNDVQYNQNVTSTKPHLLTIPSSRSPPGEDGRPALHSSLSSSSVGTFTYNELTEATNNFSASNLLGEGGFGYVHKGVLLSGKEIAVKQLKMGSDQGEREFQAELDTISRVHHKHLVTLLGYCITGDARFLVYEFVSNKTLEFHLHGNAQPVMEWRTRLKIAIGSAKGLAYLHEDCSPTIIHRDIKAANILLDFNFEAKVSDFGLAKFFSDTNSQITHVSTRVVGTFGYLAPEYASSGKLTEKSDVYSYGVMLLELITGRPPISRTDSSMTDGLVDWARHLLNEAISTRNFDDIVDPRLQKNYEFDEMASLIECAAACVRHSAWLRPRMSQIVRALEEKEPLTDHGEGNTPGHSKMYSSLDMKRLTMALASQDYESSRVSDNTSDYGLYPSCSSSEAHTTR